MTAEFDREDATPTTPRAPRKPRAVRLKSSANVRAEIGATYRAFRAGEIDVQEARTRGYLLQVLASIIRDESLGEIEEQIADLKRQGVLS